MVMQEWIPAFAGMTEGAGMTYGGQTTSPVSSPVPRMM